MLRDREEALAAMRTDLAAARIAAAKKEAEIQELHQVVGHLRQEVAEAHQAVFNVRRELEQRRVEPERRQAEPVKGPEPSQGQSAMELQHTVGLLSAEVGQLREQLGHILAGERVVRDSRPMERAGRKAQARIGATPPLAQGQANGEAESGLARVRVGTISMGPETPSVVRWQQPIQVQSGETLWGLARRHGVSVAELRRANGLDNDQVRAGQRLVLPLPQQPLP